MLSVFQKAHEGTAAASSVSVFCGLLLSQFGVVSSGLWPDLLRLLWLVSTWLITRGFFWMAGIGELSLKVVYTLKDRGQSLVNILHFSGERAFHISKPILHRRFKFRKIASETSHPSAYEFL